MSSIEPSRQPSEFADWSFNLPRRTTAHELTHALCISGADNAYAIGKGADGSRVKVTYERVPYNDQDTIQAWEDCSYLMRTRAEVTRNCRSSVFHGK